MTAFIELLFWIVIFVVFFFGFRHLQRRRQDTRDKSPEKDTSRDRGA